MESTIVYKLVRLDGGQRVSYAAGLWDIEYPANVWLQGREGTPLFAFRTKKSAVAFAVEAAEWARTEVWKAEGQNVRPAPRLVGLSTSWAKFWANGARGGRSEPPGDSVIADRLRLLERAWPKE